MGDPYFPDYGSSGYDAVRYEIAVNWDPEVGHAHRPHTITARASQPLESFYVDLALEATSAQVERTAGELTKQGFQDLKITPAEPIDDRRRVRGDHRLRR